MGALTKDDILAAQDCRIEQVSVPEWGGHVFVRMMTGAERDSFETAWTSAKSGGQVGLANFRARMAVLTLSDEAGKPLFSERDILALSAKSAAALDRVMDVAMRLNRMGDKDVEDLVGNSEAAPSGGSG